MSTATPEQVLESIVTGINSGDLESLMPLYESEAAFATQPGSLAHGAPGVREALTGFISMNGKLDLEVTRVLEVDDLALVIGVWSFDGTGPDGEPVRLEAKERGRPASSERRHLALRDRQPVGDRLNSRVGESCRGPPPPAGLSGRLLKRQPRLGQQAIQPRGHPPGARAEQTQDDRLQQQADQRGVEQHRDGEDEAHLLGRDRAGERERHEDHDHDRGGRVDHAAGPARPSTTASRASPVRSCASLTVARRKTV